MTFLTRKVVHVNYQLYQELGLAVRYNQRARAVHMYWQFPPSAHQHNALLLSQPVFSIVPSQFAPSLHNSPFFAVAGFLFYNKLFGPKIMSINSSNGKQLLGINSHTAATILPHNINLHLCLRNNKRLIQT